MERALARTDNALLLRVIDTAEPVDLGAYTRLAASGRVDGFLLCDVELDDPRFELLAAAGRSSSPAIRSRRAPSRSWRPSTRAAMAAAVEHLVGLGHRRVGFVGGSARYEFVQARLAAWRSALSRAGLEPGTGRLR